jgi:hypothetical protein
LAIQAYRIGELPFPDGAIIARLAPGYLRSEENDKVFGYPQSFVAGPPQEGVHFIQGRDKIRLDERLGVCSI